MFELAGQVSVGYEAVTLAVKRVLAAPGAEDHFRVVQEVAVDRDFFPLDGKRGNPDPIGIKMIGWHPWCPLAEEHDVGDHAGPFALEGIRRQACRSKKIGYGSQPFAERAVLFVERVMRRDKGEHAAGLQGIDGLGEEVIVQGEFLAPVIELKVGERHVANDGINPALGQFGVAEVLDADIGFRVQGFGNPPGNRIQLDTDEVPPPLAHEVADAAARL